MIHHLVRSIASSAASNRHLHRSVHQSLTSQASSAIRSFQAFKAHHPITAKIAGFMAKVTGKASWDVLKEEFKDIHGL